MFTLIQQPYIQALRTFSDDKVQVDVLRLDEVHPVVSGNKWYKLQYYLKDAIDNNYNHIVSFGGAYSNHIVALAYACKSLGLSCTGIIRGEKPKILSNTLQQAINYGMQMEFVSRERYDHKDVLLQQYLNKSYAIPEGGYGLLGVRGTATILQTVDASGYTHIICACGTGTMLGGIVTSALPHQQVLGVCVLKGYENLENDVREILGEEKKKASFTILHQYHFGGYAKHLSQLLEFMNELYAKEKLPTDIVYTSKLFFAVKDLLQQQYFENNSKILVIHSGGLQGNNGLKNKLNY